ILRVGNTQGTQRAQQYGTNTFSGIAKNFEAKPKENIVNNQTFKASEETTKFQLENSCSCFDLFLLLLPRFDMLLLRCVCVLI
nr:strictosidine-O-beta-D-glucosidase-like isoform X1 [Tanacetum cinerariifolium]